MNNEQMIPGGMDVTSWTIIAPGQPNDYVMGTMEEAYEHARKEYGIAASIRETWYGEWDCGNPETGACWHDENGVHHFRDGVPCSECGSSQPTDRLTPANEHGERVCLVCE